MGDENNDWRFKSFNDTNGAYNRIASPAAGATPVAASVNAVDRVAGQNRFIPSPSGTNWQQTFGYNQPYSPSKTDWSKSFGQNNPASPSGTNWNPRTGAASTLDLSTSQPYTGSDVSKRDFDLYGAGTDFGFSV
jgi:hypothetical protein